MLFYAPPNDSGRFMSQAGKNAPDPERPTGRPCTNGPGFGGGKEGLVDGLHSTSIAHHNYLRRSLNSTSFYRETLSSRIHPASIFLFCDVVAAHVRLCDLCIRESVACQNRYAPLLCSVLCLSLCVCCQVKCAYVIYMHVHWYYVCTSALQR